MSSRTKDKAAARERVAAMRAEQARAARRRRVLLAGGSIGVVVVLLVALVVAKAAGLGSGGSGSSASTTSAQPAAASTAVVTAVTGVPAATLDKVGAGSVQAVPRKVDAPALTSGGKPKVLYVGAEYCPFCAAQRWPVVVALSRFGSWAGLGQTTSASDDVYPDTSTLSFHGATYASDYLSFTGVETNRRTKVNGQYPKLDQLTAADSKTFQTYDQPPYITGSAGSIPFLDLGGSFVSSGASFDPQLLAGLSHRQVAAALADPTSPVAKAVDGSANVLTAALCEVTGQQPTTVCTAPGVAAGAKTLAKGTP